MLRSRHLQYVLAFSYWPTIQPRKGDNIYEIRSYRLKPGTMIEWGNNWARAINYRRNNDEPFAAFFSQVGRLYNVHHIWCMYNLFHYLICQTFHTFRLVICDCNGKHGLMYIDINKQLDLTLSQAWLVVQNFHLSY